MPRHLAPKLRLLASGGAALDPETAWRLAALGWDVSTGYGLTETSPLLTLDRPGEDRFDTVGRAIPGVELRIDRAALRDVERTEEIPEDAGEVQARGPGVFAGYRDLPAKTKEAFTDDGWFRTGDIGLLSDKGSLRLLGRLATVMKTSGRKFAQPDEIEETYEESPVLREVGVLQLEEASWLDPFVLAAALDAELLRRTQWGGWRGIVFRNTLVRALSRLGRALPIDPHAAIGTTLALGAAVLHRGEVLVWFPEGQRSKEDRLLPFRPGVGALLDGVPEAHAVPVLIRGTHAACPVGRMFPRFRRVQVVFGEPLTHDAMVKRGRLESPREAIARALHDAVADLGPSGRPR